MTTSDLSSHRLSGLKKLTNGMPKNIITLSGVEQCMINRHIPCDSFCSLHNAEPDTAYIQKHL